MAVTAVPESTVLRLVFQVGTDEEGRPILRARNVRGVKAGATDEDVYAVATALAGLLSLSLYAVQRLNTSQLIGS